MSLNPNQIIVEVNGMEITNWTSYNIEFNFFTPSDAFTLVLEDSRATSLANQLTLGTQLIIYVAATQHLVGATTPGSGINSVPSNQLNKIPLMVGYVDDISVSYSRGGGTRLTLTGRDLLGQAAQAHVMPNLGDTIATNFQVNSNQNYQYILTQIFANFQPNFPIPIILDDRSSMQTKTGGLVGSKRRPPNTVKGQETSIKRSLSHILKPWGGETYLSYAKTIVEHIGCYLKVIFLNQKLAQGIYVGPPIYLRDQPSPFALYHSHKPQQTAGNLVISGNIRFSVKEQPSVLIRQYTGGNPGYKKQTTKQICINELTGYSDILSSQVNIPFNSASPPTPQPNVQQAITTLTENYGYKLLPINYDILNVLQNFPITIGTDLSRPEFYEDINSHTTQELELSMRLKMAEAQNKFLDCTYVIQGHTTPGGRVWQPNMMCQVYDDIIYPQAPISTSLWIERVNFTKSRGEGTLTHLKLNLPFTNTAVLDD